MKRAQGWIPVEHLCKQRGEFMWHIWSSTRKIILKSKNTFSTKMTRFTKSDAFDRFTTNGYRVSVILLETHNGAVDLSHDLILRVKVDSRPSVSWNSNILARAGFNNLNHSGPRLCGVGAHVEPSRFLECLKKDSVIRVWNTWWRFGDYDQEPTHTCKPNYI